MVSQPYSNGGSGCFGYGYGPYDVSTSGFAPGSAFSVTQNIYNQQNNYYPPAAPAYPPPAMPQPCVAPQSQPCMAPQTPQVMMQAPSVIMQSCAPQAPMTVQQPFFQQPVYQQPLAMTMPIASYPPMGCQQPMMGQPGAGGLGALVSMIMQMMTQMMGLFQSGGAFGGAAGPAANTGYTDPLTGQYVPSNLNAGPIDDLNGSGRIWGDPHFVDPDGGKFDVMGEVGKTYNILSDKGLQFNAEFGVWKDFDGKNGRELKTIISKAGLTVGQSRLQFGVDGKLTIDGKAVSDGDYDLGNGARAALKGGKLDLSTREYEVRLSTNGEYLDHDIQAKNVGADGVAPHGLWGQLVDGDGKPRNGDEGGGAQGGGAIDTNRQDPQTGKFIRSEKGDKSAYQQYETNGLFDTGFASPFNRYRG